MIAEGTKEYKILTKSQQYCSVCGKEVEPKEAEFVYTKRKTYIFLHTDCYLNLAKM